MTLVIKRRIGENINIVYGNRVLEINIRKRKGNAVELAITGSKHFVILPLSKRVKDINDEEETSKTKTEENDISRKEETFEQTKHID